MAIRNLLLTSLTLFNVVGSFAFAAGPGILVPPPRAEHMEFKCLDVQSFFTNAMKPNSKAVMVVTDVEIEEQHSPNFRKVLLESTKFKTKGAKDFKNALWDEFKQNGCESIELPRGLGLYNIVKVTSDMVEAAGMDVSMTFRRDNKNRLSYELRGPFTVPVQCGEGCQQDEVHSVTWKAILKLK